MPEHEDHLSRIEHYLRTLVGYAGIDPYLAQLVQLAKTTGYGPPITFAMSGGFAVSGVLSGDEACATELDDLFESLAKQVAEDPDADEARRAAARETIGTRGFEQALASQKRELREAEAEGRQLRGEHSSADFFSLPLELRRKLEHRTDLAACTLRDARMNFPFPKAREPKENIPKMRIHLAHVVGWGIGRRA